MLFKNCQGKSIAQNDHKNWPMGEGALPKNDVTHQYFFFTHFFAA